LVLSTRFCPVNLLSLSALVPRDGHAIDNAIVGTFIRWKHTALLLIDLSPAHPIAAEQSLPSQGS
jgi:hypothetical protein